MDVLFGQTVLSQKNGHTAYGFVLFVFDHFVEQIRFFYCLNTVNDKKKQNLTAKYGHLTQQKRPFGVRGVGINEHHETLDICPQVRMRFLKDARLVGGQSHGHSKALP